MSLLFPQFLFGLFALSIPILIHLFSFRLNKTVYYSDIRFLKDIKQQTKSKTQLKHWLVLLMRLSALSALIIAFAQPYLPDSEAGTQKPVNKVGIYIDNSFSTEAEGKYGNLLETAKNKARAILSAYPPETKFLFLTNEFYSKHLHLLNNEQVKDFVNETRTAAQFRDVGEVLSKMTDYFSDTRDTADRYAVYMISDLQKTAHRIETMPEQNLADVYFLPVQADIRNNILIDSVWFETPGRTFNQQDELFVSITNLSEDDYTEVPVNLFLNDSLKAPGSLNITAGEHKVLPIKFVNTNRGSVHGRVELTDYPVTFDNTFYFSFEIPKQKKIRVLRGTTDDKYLKNIFNSDPYFEYSTNPESEIAINEISDNEVVIVCGLADISEGLNNELLNFVSDGGTLIVFPDLNSNFENYNRLLTNFGLNYITGIDTSSVFMSHINYNADILRGIFRKQEENPDLPELTKKLEFSNLTNTTEEGILFTENNEKAVFGTKFRNGAVYVFAQPASGESGNFVYHRLWAPLLFNMAVLGNSEKKISYTIGKGETIRLKVKQKSAEDLLRISSPDSTTDFIPRSGGRDGSSVRIFPDANISISGIYQIYNNTDFLQSIAYNYDRSESDLEVHDPTEWLKLCNENLGSNYRLSDASSEMLAGEIRLQQKGTKLWRFFVLASLLFILGEILIIRFSGNKLRFWQKKSNNQGLQ